MSKTYNKVVNGKIRAYIMDCVNLADYAEYNNVTEPAAEPERVRLVYQIYRDEYNHEIKRRGEYNAFPEWLCGLPTALTVEFSYCDARRVLAGWLDQSEKESAKYNDDEVWNLYLHLITREFFAMVRKYEKAAA